VAYVSTVVNTRARVRRHRGRIGCHRGTDIDNPSPGRGTL
jgi:hypothetical protein